MHIVKYPPPIYTFSWKIPTESEQKTALSELQDIKYEHFRQSLVAKTGQIIPRLKTCQKSDDHKELRPWHKMRGDEREAAFETLQVYSKDY
jgi:hypothetical protein